MRFHIKERAWSVGGNFDIRDEAGNPVFAVRGKFLSVGDDMTLFDYRSGQKLVHMKQRVFSLRPKYNLYDGNEQPLGNITQGFSFLGERFKVVGTSGATLTIKGSVLGWRFNISDDSGRQLGEVSHQLSLFRDSYAVNVVSGIDPTFIVSLAIILERVKEKQKRARAIEMMGK